MSETIKGYTLEELESYLQDIGEPKYRAKQLFNWMYNHLSYDFGEMQNIPKSLRKKLSDNFTLSALTKTNVQDSNFEGTRKYVFRTFDNREIETVIIPEGKRKTLCISTQVGCPLNCKFCATGLMGYKRNLTAGEIVDQYYQISEEYGKDFITNIVYMGMGEPLLNYKGTLNSLKIFTHELATGLSRHKITVSSIGIPQRIKELADSGLRAKFALSLHSTIDEIRTKIMPINKKYKLSDTIDAIRYYSQKTGSRITFEYTMLKGINDGDEDVKGITRLCNKVSAKVNLIPFNSIAHMDPEGFSAELVPTPAEEIETFADKLRNNNVTVMIRNTQGKDIAAACGQLAVNY
jgi:23S rRNA (adenine2503-C2)-methyltransferase